jgi:DNA mismatch endonuclease (patch repair protein)
MDVLTKEQRRKNMQAIRSKNTKMEMALRKALWEKGFRYRKNDIKVFGKPDLTFSKVKIAIFIDSEFFHGKDWNTNKFRIKTNRSFWWIKIGNNIKRDIKVNRQLKKEGWTILRFWSKDIEKKLLNCIRKIEHAIDQKKNAG